MQLMTAINVSDVGIERLEPVLQGQEVSFKERDKNSTGYRYTYVPVAVNEDRPGALELSRTVDSPIRLCVYDGR